MSNEYFQFRQFIVHQQRCAMKVGTDGTLLGAWAAAPSGKCRILDIGTGTGLIALMMAQRFPESEVIGIDIDPEAIAQARENVRLSPFSERITISHQDLMKFDDTECFDVIVSNPPYSIRWVGDDNPILINDPRFAPAGVLAPKSKADLAFTMHMLSWLGADGTAAIVEFPGVLYRGGAEQKIRQYLIDNNYIDTVIQLPANLFFGVSIATCIIVLKKNKSDNKTLFIDASEEFEHEGNKNKLMPKNIQHIMEWYVARTNSPHRTMLVSNTDIAGNGYNLSVNSYVEQEDTREVINIDALNAELKQIVARENELRAQIDELIANL